MHYYELEQINMLLLFTIDGTDEPWHDIDEHRRTINKSIQCHGQLPTSVQTVGASSKLIFISPEALQKGH